MNTEEKKEQKILTVPNPKTDVEWTSYLAIGIAEGFEELHEEDYEDADFTPADVLAESWSIIIKYGLWKNLQGFFGRQVKVLIESDIIQPDGTINWEEVYGV